ncbi:metallophosphoesterase [Candidatus Woesearchaeota archaeon]|nr:metallophosphoesterase [Candidatus Woesearchaeota archaeon]
MRQVIISDTHTKGNIECIHAYLQKNRLKYKIDYIIINGDILGEHRNKAEPDDPEKYLKGLSPDSADTIISSVNEYKAGRFIDEKKKEKLGEAVLTYMHDRYNYVIRILKEFSQIAPTLFNIGESESPLHYQVIKEIPFLLDIPPDFISKSILYTDYRSVYQKFLDKLRANESKNLKFIGGTTSLKKNILFVGIPGLNPNSVPTDTLSELQEKLTKDLLNSIKRQLSYADKLIIFNHTQSKIAENPFVYKPGSPAVRSFIQEMKGRMRQKIFIQSHKHWPTAHFFTNDDFYFLLNNAGIHNSIFNILEISNKVKCFDIDPKRDKTRELKLYDSYTAEYSSPKERLALNYENPDELIKERNLGECSYI